eukprot:scaffold148333_cov19-Tisochrysis_lutea.AAC.1
MEAVWRFANACTRLTFKKLAQTMFEKEGKEKAALSISSLHDQRNGTAVVLAAKYGNVDAVQLLVDAGANIHIPDQRGYALVCLQYRCMDALQLLVDVDDLPAPMSLHKECVFCTASILCSIIITLEEFGTQSSRPPVHHLDFVCFLA